MAVLCSKYSLDSIPNHYPELLTSTDDIIAQMANLEVDKKNKAMLPIYMYLDKNKSREMYLCYIDLCM